MKISFPHSITNFAKTLVLVTLCILSTFNVSLFAQESKEKLKNENYQSERYQIGEELFFTAFVGRHKLGDVYTIVTDAGIFIDFESYIRATDFQINLTDFLSYQGWFISEDNVFSLSRNLENRFVLTTNEEKLILTKDDIEIIDDIVYVSSSLLYKVFKIAHEFDESSLKLILHPEQKLPIQLKLERQNRKIYNGTNYQAAQYPELWRGYEILSPQSLDLSINSIYRDQSKNSTTGYSVIGGREVLYHNFRFYLSGSTQDTLSNARLLFSKNLDVSKHAKNPYVKAIEFGDVDTVSIGNSSFRSDAVGVVLTNDPTIRELNNSRTTTISGEILEGWDAELYRDEILIDSLSEINTGRYIFADVPLFLGENNFEIILYGPQGQIIKVNQSEYVDSNYVKDNKFRYKTSLTKLDSSVLPISNQEQILDDNLFDWSTQISMGISDTSTINGGLSIQSGSESINTLSLGYATSISDRTFVGTTYLYDDKDNQNLGAYLRSSLYGHDINLSYTANKVALANTTSHGLSLLNRGQISLGQNNLTYQNRVNVSIAGDKKSTNFSNSLGMRLGFGNLSHTLQYIDTHEEGLIDTNTITGSLSYRMGFRGFSTRFGFNYGEYDDGFDINSYSLDLSWSPWSNLSSRFSANYAKLSDVLNTRLDLAYTNNDFTFSSYIANSNLTGMQVGLSARVSLGGEPFNRGVFASGRDLSKNGTVIVRTFIDANANAIFDYGDSVISGVAVESVQSVARDTTNSEGLATLKGLSTTKKTDIQIKTDSIDEPFLMPIIDGVSVLPRKSFIDHIDYPLVYVSDIDGIINVDGIEFEQIKRPLQVRILNHKNEVIESTYAEYDGYFFFQGLHPGKYTIDIEKSTLLRNHLKLIRSSEVVVSNTADLISIDDITVDPIDYNVGYRVEVAAMKSLPLLNLYWNKLRSLDAEFFTKMPVFYAQDSKGYSLNIGFYQSIDTAKQYCKFLEKYPLPCKAIEYRQPKT